MKKRSLATLSGYRPRTAAATGHHCPQTGWWQAEETLTPRFISRGDVMPAVNGRATHWTMCTDLNTI